MRRLVAAAVLVTALVLAGCGSGGGDPTPVLSRTEAKLATIRSGRLSLDFRIDPLGQGSEFGFALRGPFSLGSAGSLPVANLDYTQIANGQQATATLISNGSRAWVRVGDKTYELPRAQTEELRGATRTLRADGGLAQLRIGDWIKHPELSDGGEVSGAKTDHVHADLDTSTAIGDLLSLSRRFGGSVPSLDAASRKRLVAAARSATLDVYSGKTDALLRKLQIDANFGLNVPDALASALGKLVGAKIRFDLEIANPNTQVHVTAPQHALPASQFPGG